ncbi:MAG: substrate-binding domain-containing protein [Breznakibacter sp.]
MQKHQTIKKFSTIMAFVYAMLGLVLLFAGQDFGMISGNVRIAMGILLLLYGSFRIYLVFHKKSTNNHLSVFAALSMVFFASCHQGGVPQGAASASDTVHVYVDETFKPIIEAGSDVFSAMDTIQILKIHYVPESEAIGKLLEGQGVLAVVSRELSKDEIAMLNKKTYYPKHTKIAVDAIGIIANPAITDSVLSVEQIKNVLAGKLKNWKELGTGNKNLPIRVLFDNPQSGIVRYMADSICNGQPFNSQSFAMDVNVDVIDYVAQHEDVMGFIGTSWISNRNDTQHLSFHSKVKVMYVCPEADCTAGNSYQPFQAYIFDGMYPFTRNVFMINSEPNVGKATRFCNFMAGEKGQRIILKSGILPAVAPTRIINVREKI